MPIPTKRILVFILILLYLLPATATSTRADEELTLNMCWNDVGSQAVKDEAVRHGSDEYSYHISSSEANDVRILLSFPVEKNTFYVARTWVKTENVVPMENKDNPVGAGIGAGRWNNSDTLLGSRDWTLCEVPVFSGESDTVELSLFLGYWSNTCVGDAWFSPPQLIKAPANIKNATTWRFLYVIPKCMDVRGTDESTGEAFQCTTSLSNQEIAILMDGFERVQQTINQFGAGLFQIKYQVLILDEPYTQPLSYHPEYGYNITEEDARTYLNDHGVSFGEYDHVFMVSCAEGVPPNDVFGLGGTVFDGKTMYSAIEFDSHADIENWGKDLEQENIFIHEFLHGMETTCRDFDHLDCPGLHDRDQYGYLYDLEWYRDYIRGQVRNCEMENDGIPAMEWKRRPSEQ